MRKQYFLIILLFTLLFTCCRNPTEWYPINEQSPYQWNIATTAEASLNDTLVTAGMAAAQNLGYVNSIIIIRHGKICIERYFNGKNENSNQTVRSVSKSFLSAMVGIAVDKGLLNLDQKFVDFYPEYRSAYDQRFNNITLRHLLTMRSGIRGDEEIYFSFAFSGNWINTIANIQLAFDPGTAKLYSTAGTHLVSAMLTKASGMSSLEFANRYLLGPMGLTIKGWSKDPQGIYFGGNEMFFTARDIAVLGLLYLNKGALNNQQIVPESWVNSSIVHSTTGATWGAVSKVGYGYLWWSGELAGHKAFFALGHGGQYIMCVPDLDLIISTLSYPDGDWDSADVQERGVNQIIASYFIPAAR